MLLIGLLFCFPTAEFVLNKIKQPVIKKSIEVALILGVFILSISELANTNYNPFIYFRF